jgi:hypothetical protein
MDPLVLNVLERFLCGDKVSSSSRIARIVKEDGEYCVKSEDPNSTWSGGCYKSEEKAKARLKQVEFFKHNKSAAMIAYAKSNDIAFSKLKNMSRKELEKLGCGIWAHEDGEALMLFPAEWYDQLPNGLEITSISGDNREFERGKSDRDHRMGYLPYGVTVKLAVWKAMLRQ